MKRDFGIELEGWFLALCLLAPSLGGAAQFVELNAEVEINDWDYWFLSDRKGAYPGEERVPSIFPKSHAVRCVVGADSWMIESELPAYRVTRWFTGTNIIESTIIKEQTPDAVVKRMAERSNLAITAPPVGSRNSRIYESVDGNPGRPVRVPDLMGFDVPARVSWLACCSGPALKRGGRRIFPPSDLWKESSIVYSGWSDSTEVFKDELGLPKSISLVSTNGQSIFRYQVRQSTNVLGWNFPLEFYGVQYLPTGTNGWKLHVTLKGKVTNIGATTKPEIPPEVFRVIER